MLKLEDWADSLKAYWQPPSGGCVLKPVALEVMSTHLDAAAFGRLCVETSRVRGVDIAVIAAAFGRLCVETHYVRIIFSLNGLQPPSGGCVLKLPSFQKCR